MKNLLVKCAFIIPITWWVYLFFTTQIVVVFDAAGYEAQGRLLYEQGWSALWGNGLQREPLFLWIIAAAMFLGDLWHVSYFYPLKMIGLLFLLLTMGGAYWLMQLMSVHRAIAAAAIFYLGVSPVMTNSSMRLWSEFAAYPLVLLVVLWAIKSWQFIRSWPERSRLGYWPVIGYGLAGAGIFFLLMSVKAVAEGLLIFFLWPFYWLAWLSWRQGKKFDTKKIIIFCATILLVFEGMVVGYKWINWHHNGQFSFTNRGESAFYSNNARRMEPLTWRRFKAAVAFVPGMGLCPALYGHDTCDFWSARYSDDIIGQKTAELTAQGLSFKEQSAYFISQGFAKIAANPLQALLLMVVEGHKMFFWESCIAFVAYPDWLEQIFYSPLFAHVMMTTLAIMSWLAVMFGMGCLIARGKKPLEALPDGHAVLLWVVNFVFWYIGMYSLFFIVDRYAFPLISLYVVLMAFATDTLFKYYQKRRY